MATSSTSLKWEKKTLMERKQEGLTCIRCKWQFNTKNMHLHNDKCQEHPSTMTYNLGLPSVLWRNTLSSKYSDSHPHSETHIFPQRIDPIAWRRTKHKGSGLSPWHSISCMHSDSHSSFRNTHACLLLHDQFVLLHEWVTYNMVIDSTWIMPNFRLAVSLCFYCPSPVFNKHPFHWKQEWKFSKKPTADH
jgi:hypothetical protein